MSSKSLAIVVTDPDPLMCETIGEMLKCYGHTVTAVTEMAGGLRHRYSAVRCIDRANG